jgi:cytoskeleton protein RodZ
LKEEDKRESIGGYLKRLREQLGFTLQDIASKTKISLAYLGHLENEEFSALPNEVFIKGFLRSYAQVLGLKESDLLDRFKEWKSGHEAKSTAVGGENPAATGEPEKNRWPTVPLGRIRSLYEPKSSLRRKILFNLLIGMVIVIGGIILFSKRNLNEEPIRPGEPLSSETSSPPPPQIGAPATALTSGAIGSSPMTTEKSPVKAPLLHLTVQATERSWVSAVIDDGVMKEFSLHPEDKVTLEAEKRFLLNIGNAGGVKLTLNGKPLGPYGKRGEIVKGIKIEP